MVLPRAQTPVKENARREEEYHQHIRELGASPPWFNLPEITVAAPASSASRAPIIRLKPSALRHAPTSNIEQQPEPRERRKAKPGAPRPKTRHPIFARELPALPRHIDLSSVGHWSRNLDALVQTGANSLQSSSPSSVAPQPQRELTDTNASPATESKHELPSKQEEESEEESSEEEDWETKKEFNYSEWEVETKEPGPMLELNRLRTMTFRHLQRRVFKHWSWIEREIGLNHIAVKPRVLARILRHPKIKAEDIELVYIQEQLNVYLEHPFRDWSYGEVDIPVVVLHKVLHPTAEDGHQLEAEEQKRVVIEEQFQRSKTSELQHIDDLAKRRHDRYVKKVTDAITAHSTQELWTSPQSRQDTISTLMRCIREEYQTECLKKHNTSDDDIWSQVAKDHTLDIHFSNFQKAIFRHYILFGDFAKMPLPTLALAVHDVAASFLQRWIRALKMKHNSDMLRERRNFFEYLQRRDVFQAWKMLHLRLLRLYRVGLRHYLGWKKETQRLRAFNQTFRVAFYPFYVWVRMTKHEIDARKKARFLVQVWHCHVRLRHFRALQTLFRFRKTRRQVVHTFQTFWRLRKLDQIYREWHQLAIHRHAVLANLLRGDNFHRQYFRNTVMREVFILWKYRTIIEAQMVSRCLVNFRSMLNLPLLTTKVPNAIWTFSDMITATTHRLDRPFKYPLHIYDKSLKVYQDVCAQESRESKDMAVRFKIQCRRILVEMHKYMVRKKKGRYATFMVTQRIKRVVFRELLCATLYLDTTSAFSGQPNEEGKEIVKARSVFRRRSNLNIAATSMMQDILAPLKKQKQNILTWKKDRETRLNGIELCRKDREQLAQDRRRIAEDVARRSASWQETLSETSRYRECEATVLIEREEHVQESLQSLRHFISQIKRTRGRRFHHALVRGFEALEFQSDAHLLRRVLRQWRAPIWQLKFEHLFHRAQLRNSLRLCVRFRFMERNISQFRNYWLQHRHFEAWLRMWHERCLARSPGLANKIRRQRKLLDKYESFLDQHQIIDSSPVKAKTSLTNTRLDGIFYRWVDTTQYQINYRKYVAIFQRRAQIRQLHRMFRCFQYIVARHHSDPTTPRPFLLTRAQEDLAIIRSRIFVFRHKSLQRRIRRVFHFSIRLIKTRGSTSPSFKKLTHDFQSSIESRLMYEQRLMISSYNERHIHHYLDSKSVCSNPQFEFHDLVTKSNYFCDPDMPSFDSIRSLRLVYGKKLTGFQLQRGRGKEEVGGTSFTWSDNHGAAEGQCSFFELEAEEFLTEVEVWATSVSVNGIRFGTSSGRHSKWYGRRDRGEYSRLGPAPNAHIVGFYGLASQDHKIEALGVTLRHTTLRNIFRGLWTRSYPGQDREFAYFLQLRALIVRRASARVQHFIISAWRLVNLPPVLGNMRWLVAIGEWLLNACTHGLVHVPQHEKQALAEIQSGLNQVKSGQEHIDAGNAILNSLEFPPDELLRRQNQVAIVGSVNMLKILETLERGQALVQHGARDLATGQSRVMSARQTLPAVRTSVSMINHIHELYALALTRHKVEESGALQDELMDLHHHKNKHDKKFSGIMDSAMTNAIDQAQESSRVCIGRPGGVDHHYT